MAGGNVQGKCLAHSSGRLTERREGQDSPKLSSKPTLSRDKVTAELMFEGKLSSLPEEEQGQALNEGTQTVGRGFRGKECCMRRAEAMSCPWGWGQQSQQGQTDTGPYADGPPWVLETFK